jgi:hypothetical protein
MSGNRLLLAVVVTTTVLLASAQAQKNELAGGIGRTFISNQGIKPGPVPIFDNEVHFGNGLTFELNYARRIINAHLFALDGEIPFVGDPNEKLHSGDATVPSKYSSYFITPAARLKLFPGSILQPWISVGGGFGHFHFDETTNQGLQNTGSLNKNSGLFQAGIGLDVRTFRKVLFRLAARDFISGSLPLNVDTGKSHQHNIAVTGGLAFQF